MVLQEVAGALVYAGQPRWQEDIAGCNVRVNKVVYSFRG